MATLHKLPVMDREAFDPARWFAEWSDLGGIAFVVNERLFLSRPISTPTDSTGIAMAHDELFRDRRHGEALAAYLIARSFGEEPLAPPPPPVDPRAVNAAGRFREGHTVTLLDILAAMKRHSLSASRFSIEATEDPRLIADMRRGRNIGPKLQAKIRAYIEELDREAGL